MIKRHEDSLMARIDALSWRGITEIEWWELSAWYGLERITKTVWRDIRDRFVELQAGDPGEIQLIDRPDRVILINTGWTKPITDKF